MEGHTYNRETTATSSDNRMASDSDNHTRPDGRLNTDIYYRIRSIFTPQVVGAAAWTDGRGATRIKHVKNEGLPAGRPMEVISDGTKHIAS
ncbi:hypothetical protein MJO28_005331 [Puccinia striiformis f. sp. tritici]|uniref:Uncharacterized protein n=1 Tax=Puccinia striiformis f. sp. tritici TaxID=168172 RepID=A0ACC0EK09_9BASI|nr:hypothetical protein MJO28_005331 [Puccinia striiformis f. sp. tritici]